MGRCLVPVNSCKAHTERCQNTWQKQSMLKHPYMCLCHLSLDLFLSVCFSVSLFQCQTYVCGCACACGCLSVSLFLGFSVRCQRGEDVRGASTRTTHIMFFVSSTWMPLPVLLLAWNLYLNQCDSECHVKCNKPGAILSLSTAAEEFKELGARFFLNLWNNQVKELPHVGYIKQKTWFVRSRAATSFPNSPLLSTYMHSLQQANSRKNFSSAPLPTTSEYIP